MDHSPTPPVRPADLAAHAPVRWGAVASIVGFLALVEITSGILQGYYTPLMTDIARRLGIHDADVNWFEAAQLMVSALAVPLLASLGDIFGHKRMLLVSAIVTAAASWAVVFAGSFTTFLVAWAFQGFYAVWLPLEIAIVFSRARKLGAPGPITRRAAGLLVGALQFGVIAGALAGGALIGLFGGNLALTMVVPAVATTLCVFAVGFGVPDDGARNGAKIDGGGFGYLAVGLLLLTSGLSFLRINGPASPLVWGCLALGLAVLYVFYRHENKQDDPLIDFKVLFARSMWPLQLTAGLFGVSVLGAQIPMSTFARTDPAVNGYGLGMGASGVSIIIGAYVLSLLVGALLFPVACKADGHPGDAGGGQHADRHRIPDVPAAARVAGAGADQHGCCRPRIRRAGGGPSRGRCRRGAVPPDGHGHGADQRGEDDRRVLRLGDLRPGADRAGRGRGGRGRSRELRGPAGRLHGRVGDLRRNGDRVCAGVVGSAARCAGGCAPERLGRPA